jgi:hypothetical protein
MTAPPNLPARRPRHNGWTADKQEAFLKALATCGCVTDAARSVGMSRESAYHLYNRESAADFRRGWDAALDCSLRLLEDELWSRAIKGVPRPVFYQGEQVGEYRHFDEKLAMFLLRFRRPHRYAELPRYLPPAPPPGAEEEGTDPDEALGSLSCHLEGLVDDDSLPGEPPTIDAVNFVKFVGLEQPSGSADSVEETATAGQRVGGIEDDRRTSQPD